MRLPRSAAALKPLSYYAAERQVFKEDAVAWAQITPWQRKGFIALRWADTGAFCYVKATPAGIAEAKRLSSAEGQRS